MGAFSLEKCCKQHFEKKIIVIEFKSFFSRIFVGDLNNDGYFDLLINHNDDRFPEHTLYVWNSYEHQFVKIEFIGFDSLMYFEIEDGYLTNSVRTFERPILQTIIWDGNSLILIDEKELYFE